MWQWLFLFGNTFATIIDSESNRQWAHVENGRGHTQLQSILMKNTINFGRLCGP